jgi:transposase
MWVRVARPPAQGLILFDYDASRGTHVAERLLEGATGYVQSDGYAVYDGADVRLNLTHVGCMAQARRRSFEAIQALPKPEQRNNTAAHEIVRRIDALYAIERQKQPTLLLYTLQDFTRSLERQTLPSSKLGEALT